MGPDRARLLVVCTGNLCRSPLAMLLLQRRLAVLGPAVEVTSAGTRAAVGEPMVNRAAAQARGLGLDPSGVTSRQLDVAAVAEADLVLTATLEHRSQVVASHVPALRYAFTLLELARLLRSQSLPALPEPVGERVRALAQLGVALRGQVTPPRAGSDDVPDPIGGSARQFAEVTRMLDPATETVAAALLAGGGAAVDEPQRLRS